MVAPAEIFQDLRPQLVALVVSVALVVPVLLVA